MENESPEEEPLFDYVARSLVEMVKTMFVEGPQGEHRDQAWYQDHRAEIEELLDEDALFELARAQAADALRPVIRAVLDQATEDINRLP
jgi:hypothetical protein